MTALAVTTLVSCADGNYKLSDGGSGGGGGSSSSSENGSGSGTGNGSGENGENGSGGSSSGKNTGTESDAPVFDLAAAAASFNYDGKNLYIDTAGIWWGDKTGKKKITDTAGQVAPLAPLSWEGGDCVYRASVTKDGAATSDIICSISGADASLSCPDASVLTAGDSYTVAISASAGAKTSEPAEVTITVIADKRDENGRYPDDPLYIDATKYKYRTVFQAAKGTSIHEVYQQLIKMGLKEGVTYRLEGKEGTASAKYSGSVLKLSRKTEPSNGSADILLTSLKGSAEFTYEEKIQVSATGFTIETRSGTAEASADLYRRRGSVTYIIELSNDRWTDNTFDIYEKNYALTTNPSGYAPITNPSGLKDGYNIRYYDEHSEDARQLAVSRYQAAKKQYIDSHINAVCPALGEALDLFILYEKTDFS